MTKELSKSPQGGSLTNSHRLKEVGYIKYVARKVRNAIVGDSPVAQYIIMLPSDTQYRALQKCYQTLVAQLDYRSIGPRMVSGHVVDLSQHDRIRHEPSDYARNEAFLSVLMTKCSKDQFGVFLRTLESDETLRNVFDIIQGTSRLSGILSIRNCFILSI